MKTKEWIHPDLRIENRFNEKFAQGGVFESFKLTADGCFMRHDPIEQARRINLEIDDLIYTPELNRETAMENKLLSMAHQALCNGQRIRTWNGFAERIESFVRRIYDDHTNY